jgi:hypothetical protein
VTWVDEYQFSEDFDDLRADPVRADRLAGELAAELSSGHPLRGQAWTIVAQARPQDEAVVTTDSAVYLVHLPWTRRPERPPYPRVLAFQSAAEFEDTIKCRY